MEEPCVKVADIVPSRRGSGRRRYSATVHDRLEPDATAALERVLASLSYLLTRSQTHARQAGRAEVRLGRADAYLLMALDGGGGVSRVGDLAARLVVEPSHVTRQVAWLEAQGLVERSRDTADGRARKVVLTAQGGAALARLRAANQAGLREALQDVDEEDIAATVRVLDQITERYAREVRGARALEAVLPAAQ